MFKKLIDKLGSDAVATIVVILILIVGLAFSWICTCGVIKLITLCFGWTFKWSVATGIWLVMCLA